MEFDINLIWHSQGYLLAQCVWISAILRALCAGLYLQVELGPTHRGEYAILSAICCLLSVVWWLLSAVCYLVSAVCCLLSDVAICRLGVCFLPSAVCRLLSGVGFRISIV
jgi:hypothetical protein